MDDGSDGSKGNWRRSTDSFVRSRGLALAAFILFALSALIVALLISPGTSSGSEIGAVVRCPPVSVRALPDCAETNRLSDAAQAQNRDAESTVITPSTICAVGGDVIMRGHAEVGSSAGAINAVHANGAVWLRGSTLACGEVSATGTVGIRGKANAESIEEFAPQVSSPDVAISRYSREADEGTYWDGTCVIDSPCCLGPAYVAGDLIVRDGAAVDLCGTVYVEGDIRLSGGCRLEGSGVLVAEGDLTICGEVLLDGESDRLVVSVYGDIRVIGNGSVLATLCAPDGDVFLTGNCMVYGDVVGLSIAAGGNTFIHGIPV